MKLKRLVLVVGTALMTSLNNLTVFADSAIDRLVQSGENMIDAIVPATWILVAIAFIVIGLMMVAGGQKGREAAKSAFPWVVVGCIIIVGAVQIARWLVEMGAF